MSRSSLVIFGSRNAFPTANDIERGLGLLGMEHWEVYEVVSGACPTGADRCGEQWAGARNLRVKRFPADWEKHGKRAGFIRNREMASYAHCGLGFWKGESNGTANMASWLVAEDKPVRLVLL